jgi:F420-non-reducing hydrogenase large subunit
VTPPRAATLLRQALNFGSILHSHGIHFFALAGPDLILGVDADPAERNIVALLKHAPDVAKDALRLRTIGQRVTEIIGGRGTHPVASVAGGIAAPLDTDRAATLKKLSLEALTLGGQLVDTARDALLARPELVGSLPIETHYMGTVNNGKLDFYDGVLRLRSPAGEDYEFSEDDWASHLSEATLPSSYAKVVTCRTPAEEAVSYRVGALARLNCADAIDTPLAAAELERFRQLHGSPCHQTVMYHYARLVELLYAAEKLSEITADPEIGSDEVQVAPKGAPRDATAHVEAPRGVLIHDYKVDPEGIVTGVNLIVATQQNMASINDTIAMSASQFLECEDNVMLNGIEFGIRCYDPCLSCATHRLGEMKLEVVVRRNGEHVRTARR